MNKRKTQKVKVEFNGIEYNKKEFEQMYSKQNPVRAKVIKFIAKLIVWIGNLTLWFLLITGIVWLFKGALRFWGL